MVPMMSDGLDLGGRGYGVYGVCWFGPGWSGYGVYGVCWLGPGWSGLWCLWCLRFLPLAPSVLGRAMASMVPARLGLGGRGYSVSGRIAIGYTRKNHREPTHYPFEPLFEQRAHP